MGGGGIGGGKGNRQRGKNGSSEPRKEKENERAGGGGKSEKVVFSSHDKSKYGAFVTLIGHRNQYRQAWGHSDRSIAKSWPSSTFQEKSELGKVAGSEV